ncbi:hypothetical protein AGMMS50239_23810 [Bacteroidia bacterium]|nr:hypothetical protein AGMMS50239_23810 [Bacteroidia bacterium]
MNDSRFSSSILAYILMFVVVAIGILVLCSFFLFLNINEYTGYYVEVEKNEYGRKIYEHEKELTLIEYIGGEKNPQLVLSQYIKIVFLSWGYFNEIFFIIEKKKEKNASALFVLLVISLWLIKGNPLINNYYGVYKTYEVETRAGSVNEEYSKIIVQKNIVKQTINSIENNCEDWEDCDVNKRGYIFLEAGMFDGFYNDADKKYFSALKFSFLEILIHTAMYFAVPFLTVIIIKNRIKYKRIRWKQLLKTYC